MKTFINSLTDNNKIVQSGKNGYWTEPGNYIFLGVWMRKIQVQIVNSLVIIYSLINDYFLTVKIDFLKSKNSANFGEQFVSNNQFFVTKCNTEIVWRMSISNSCFCLSWKMLPWSKMLQSFKCFHKVIVFEENLTMR